METEMANLAKVLKKPKATKDEDKKAAEKRSQNKLYFPLQN